MDPISIEPADDGLALKPDERDVLDYFRGGGTNTTVRGRDTVIDALECLGRIRADNLANFVNGDLTPLVDVRHRVRRALDRVTRFILNEDDRLRFEHTIALRNLTGSYVALGGDLELEAQVSGAEYARLAGELNAIREDVTALSVAADAVLDTIHGHASDVLVETPALEDVRTALLALAKLRGRA